MCVIIPYLYVDYKCIVVWVMETSGIFLHEPNYEVVDSCHLWNVPYQLEVLNHPQVGLACLLGRIGSCTALYNHPYVSQRWLGALIFSLGRLSLGLF